MKHAISAVTLLLCHAAMAAPTLVVNGAGQLAGARGLIVQGQSYDVQFADGTCAALFNGCTSSANFTFQTAPAADAAASALTEVFTDSALGLFDTNPGLVVGCIGALTGCNTLIPYVFNGNFIITRAYNNGASSVEAGNPFTSQFSFRYAAFDSSTIVFDNFAIFAPSVPEVSTAAMFLAGLLLIQKHQRGRSPPEPMQGRRAPRQFRALARNDS
jgi:hypothetical protein